ncbi:MAG: DHH family phosphoesterase [Desulfuromonadaceae bacterium]|nr:DHH family phosphoesterase [Desulfuromonadaceae bacterium]
MPIDSASSSATATAIIDWVRGKGRILIVTHDNPDPDALASAYALQQIFSCETRQEATITFGGIIGRGENRTMVRELEICTVPIDRINFDDYAITCLVDTQPGAGNNSFPADRKVDIVIDHHPRQPSVDLCRWQDIREDYGACATILYEYLLASKVYIGTKLATILFYAIKTETQDLGREWSPSDRAAYLNLLHLANNQILYRITHPSLPRSYFHLFHRALDKAQLYNSLLTCNLGQINNPDIVAEMADFLLRVEGVDSVLAMGRYQHEGILSLRVASYDLYAGRLMRRTIDGYGSGGGHGMTAGGQIKHLADDVNLDELLELFAKRLLEILERPVVVAVRLLADDHGADALTDSEE